MFQLPVRTRILNAAVFSGQHGAVTRQADRAGGSRQTVYRHAHKLEQRLGAEPTADPPTEERSRPGGVAAPGPSAGPRILLDTGKEISLQEGVARTVCSGSSGARTARNRGPPWQSLAAAH